MVAYRSPTSAGWNKLTVKPAKLKVKSSGSLAVSVGNALYFIGGVGNVQMWSFSLSQDAWKLLCAEQVGDFYSPLVVLYAYCPSVRPEEFLIAVYSLFFFEIELFKFYFSFFNQAL